MNFRGLNVTYWIDRWIPFFGNPADANARLTHRYYQFLCSILTFFFILFASHSYYLGLHKLAFGQTLIIVVLGLSTALYRKTRSIHVAVSLVLALSSPITFYRCWVTGGIESPMLFGWPVISTLVLMTLPFRWAMFWTGVHMAFATYYYIAFLNGVVFPINAPEHVLSNVRIAMICTVQVIMLASVYCIRKLNQEHRETLRTQGEKITDLVRALSHDLSSPMMTLQHWIKSAIKKDGGDIPSLNTTLTQIQNLSKRLAGVKEVEALHSGKAGVNLGVTEQDPEIELSRGLFFFTVIALSTIFGAFACYYFYLGLYTIAGLQAMLPIALWGSWVWYRRSGAIDKVGSALMMVGCISGIIRAKMLGGINSPAFFVWPIIPAFTGILLNMRFAAFWTTVYIGIAVYYDVHRRLGIEHPSILSTHASVQVRFVALVCVQILVVTAIYYLKKQNLRFKLQIEEQSRRKADLLRTLTRDVGAPLAAIQRTLSSLPSSSNIEFAVHATNSCLDIISCIGTIESQAVGSVEAIDLREIVREVTFLQQNALQTKGIQWIEDLPASTAPLLVHGDRRSLAHQVLNNVVSNAIKFTSSGGRIALRVQPGASDSWQISVEDSGVGIPESILNKLFDPNQQTTRLGTDGEKGTGFGMPIVKKFVEQYGGNISVESKTVEQNPQGHGTAVRISLPKAAEQLHQAA